MVKWRVNFILGIVILAGFVAIGQLFSVQVVRHDFYKALAQGLYGADSQTAGERGEIFFNGEEALAVNAEWPFLFSSPVEVESKESAAIKVSEAVGISEEEALEKLEKENLYTVFKKKLDSEEVEKIKEIEIRGIYLGEERGRYYPQEDLASQLVGFLDAEKSGQYGLEGFYDQFLSEDKGEKGSDLFLNIDYSIQFAAENLLEEAKENLGIEEGQIIVAEPFSGKILAMANFPNFNPNNYSKAEDISIFQNSATQKIFEPGSVFKPLTMAAAINENKISPSATYTDPGVVEIGGWPLYNYDHRVYPGEITMTEVLEKSINTGAIFAKNQLGNTLFLKYIEKFGIFEPTEIDLEESYSQNKGIKEGYEVNFATASYGQGIEMTPIQLVRAYCAIANGGNLVRPYIVGKMSNFEETIEIKPAIKEEKVVSSKTASQVTAMLVSVVENGFAKSAQVPGYYVAGKTGTALIPFKEKRGYREDSTIQSFIGFAPAFNPRFVILVKLDSPQSKTAEYSAVPIFRDLAKKIIDYYQIPPDYEKEKK